MRMDYKLTVQVKEDRALVGLQKPEVDPFLKMVTLEGEDDQARLAALGQGLAALVAEAEAHWATAPKFAPYTPPKVEAPTKPAAPAKAKAEATPKGGELPKEKAAAAKEPEGLTQGALPFF